MMDDQDAIMKVLSARRLSDAEELERSNALSLAHAQAFEVITAQVERMCARARKAGYSVPLVKPTASLELPVQGQVRGFVGHEVVVSLSGKPGALVFRSYDAHRIHVDDRNGSLGHVCFSRNGPGSLYEAVYVARSEETPFGAAAVDNALAEWAKMI